MSRAKLLAAVLGAVGLVAAVAYAGVGAVAQAAERVGLAGLVIVALIHLPVIALTGSAWSFIGNRQSGASPWKFIWARYVREATAEVLPFSQLGGIVAGVRALSLAGLSGLPAMSSMLVDVIVEQLAKLPYVLAGAILLLIGHHAASLRLATSAVLPAGVLALAVIVYRQRLLSMLEGAARLISRRWPAVRIGPDIGPDIGQALRQVSAPDRRTTAAFATHTLAWMLGALETWIIFHLMGVAVTVTGALIIDSLFCGLRTFGFAVPAALGVQEAGYVLVCALLGIPAAPAVACSLIRRAREWVTGIPGLGVWQLIESRRAFGGAAVSAAPPEDPSDRPVGPE